MLNSLSDYSLLATQLGLGLASIGEEERLAVFIHSILADQLLCFRRDHEVSKSFGPVRVDFDVSEFRRVDLDYVIDIQ